MASQQSYTPQKTYTPQNKFLVTPLPGWAQKGLVVSHWIPGEQLDEGFGINPQKPDTHTHNL